MDFEPCLFQDPQTAEIIRELEQRKKEAIKGVKNFVLDIHTYMGSVSS